MTLSVKYLIPKLVTFLQEAPGTDCFSLPTDFISER